MFKVDALLTTKETVYVWPDSAIQGNTAKTPHSSLIEEIYLLNIAIYFSVLPEWT